MKSFSFAKAPKFVPELDPGFRPMALANRAYREAVEASGNAVDVKIALVRTNDVVATYTTKVFGEGSGHNEDNMVYIDRLVKALLWIKGGYKVVFGGPQYIGEYLVKAYRADGERAFDADFMAGVYEHDFEVVATSIDKVPVQNEVFKSMGRNLDGYRIGFDAGGSDRKVSAVVNGESIYSEEVVWYPKLQTDPNYHYEGILDSMKRAAAKMPKVDAIGVSAAGIYINNRAMVASLFMKVPKDDFDRKIKNIFLDIARDEFDNVPIEVANDGDVTALAGAMSLGDNRVLGLAMGTSEAAGYVDGDGNITGWLNELAFAPVDYNVDAMVDEWSGDVGCGVKYFSQDSVIKLAPAAGIELDEALSPAEKLKVVQGLMAEGHEGAKKIYESIGYYLGYALAYYGEFYDIKHVLLLGRVTSGEGGDIIIKNAREVIEKEFTEMNKKMEIIVPDEKSRRVGQSVAAASLPKL